MAHKRVTMQDIADACGLSRNTVSKIFNGRGAVPETTQHTVLQKAQELGYYQVPEPAAAGVQPAAGRRRHNPFSRKQNRLRHLPNSPSRNRGRIRT